MKMAQNRSKLRDKKRMSMNQLEDNAHQPSLATPSRRKFLQQSAATLACLSLVPSSLYAYASDAATVSTPLGKLRGEATTDVRIFRGIPFAQPPVGPLRFRPPVAVKPWKHTRDALTFGPQAIQPGDAKIPQSEDCLTLNIWAPTGKGPYPVFVWIHGGGYTGGRSFDPRFDGTHFTRQDIIVVSVAYRLGVFGFMDLEPLLGPSYADSGNNSLRDLITSLEWVNQNIASFGGDPTRVTIGGESAGAKATAGLMGLPQASGLFQSAISESGGGERILTHAQATEVATSYGDLWRSAHPSSAANFSDLLTAKPTDLITTQTAVVTAAKLHFPFRSELGSFLTKRPVDLVADGSTKGKRLLIGTNRDESAAFIGPNPQADPTSSDLGNLDLTRFDEVFAKYKSIYPEMTESQLRIRAVTAEEYWVPSVRLADAHASNGGPTWMYRLDYAKQSGRYAHEAEHGIDLGLVWQKPDAIEQADLNFAPLAQQMHQAWAAFIKGGKPEAAGLPDWTPYHPDTRATMILAPQSEVMQNPNNAELQLWNGIL
jgi:para-nitrobenzyl esterase